jgi:hypothetical protein
MDYKKEYKTIMKSLGYTTHEQQANIVGISKKAHINAFSKNSPVAKWCKMFVLGYYLVKHTKKQ